MSDTKILSAEEFAETADCMKANLGSTKWCMVVDSLVAHDLALRTALEKAEKENHLLASSCAAANQDRDAWILEVRREKCRAVQAERERDEARRSEVEWAGRAGGFQAERNIARALNVGGPRRAPDHAEQRHLEMVAAPIAGATMASGQHGTPDVFNYPPIEYAGYARALIAACREPEKAEAGGTAPATQRMPRPRLSGEESVGQLRSWAALSTSEDRLEVSIADIDPVVSLVGDLRALADRRLREALEAKNYAGTKLAEATRLEHESEEQRERAEKAEQERDTEIASREALGRVLAAAEARIANALEVWAGEGGPSWQMMKILRGES